MSPYMGKDELRKIHRISSHRGPLDTSSRRKHSVIPHAKRRDTPSPLILSNKPRTHVESHRIAKKKRVSRKPLRFSGGRYSSTKALFGRSILEINILRLLGARVPTYGPKVVLPPVEMKIRYGLENYGSRDVVVLTESPTEKMQLPENHLQFWSLDARLKYEAEVDLPIQKIYTDGSYYHSLESIGYAVWWGKDHALNACGPVPTDGPLSSEKAEEYALFLALLEVKAETRLGRGLSKKYIILTDCLWAKLDIQRWLKRWNKSKSLIGWKTPPSTSTEHREILRVAAGILWDLRLRGVIVDIRYVKGHNGTLGNEVADLMAKQGGLSGQFRGPQPTLL